MGVAPSDPPPAAEPYSLYVTSFRPPAVAAGSVRREALLALLDDPDAPPITALIAPPGYGKTTLLAVWAAQEHRPVAWLTLTDLDNDPMRLMAGLIAAYARVGPLPRDITGPLRADPDRLLAEPLPRLLAHLSTWEHPAILVLDDIHRITDQDTLDLVSMWLDRLPAGFRVALAGRSEPRLPFARLRAQRMLREIGIRDLALDAGETAELARHAGVALDDQEARELTARTEGWATGVYLAVLAGADRGERTAVGHASGADRYISDYLRSEVGRGLAADDLVFLTRTSVLDIVTPGAALAVAGIDRPAERLESLAAGNLLIRPVEGMPDTYRYHATLREYLQAELEKREPAEVAGMHARAAAHYAGIGAGEAAIEHAFAARDHDAAARYFSDWMLPLWQTGQATVLLRWLGQFSVSDLERHPMLAVGGAWLCLITGRPERAEVLADIADRSQVAGTGEAGRTFLMAREALRATMGRHGAADAVERAMTALRDPATPRQWRSTAATVLSLVHLAEQGGLTAADSFAEEALSIAPETAYGVQMSAYAIRSLVRLHEGRLEDAAAFAASADEVLAGASNVGALSTLIVHAVTSRVQVLRGDLPGARETLVRAQLIRSLASYASPWQSVPALIELARAYLAMSDPGGAQTVIRQAEDIVRRRPGLGGWVGQLLDMRRRLQEASDVLAGSSTLTTAELRVLPLLPTYLSFEEIGERLGVSRNTVKTHAMSIYGKLWASSRGEAVERAVVLGLLEPYPVLERHPGPGAEA